MNLPEEASRMTVAACDLPRRCQGVEDFLNLVKPILPESTWKELIAHRLEGSSIFYCIQKQSADSLSFRKSLGAKSVS